MMRYLRARRTSRSRSETLAAGSSPAVGSSRSSTSAPRSRTRSTPDPLPLPAREKRACRSNGCDVALRESPQHLVKPGCGDYRAVRPLVSVFNSEQDVLARALVEREGPLPHGGAARAPGLLGDVTERDAIDENLALSAGKLAAKDSEQGRLAGPVGFAHHHERRLREHGGEAAEERAPAVVSKGGVPELDLARRGCELDPAAPWRIPGTLRLSA